MIRNTITTFVPDERGVSEVLGAVLVFGLVVALLSIVQIHAVPNANEEVEFEHNQKVQTDMSELQEAISLTAAQGRSQSPSIELGLSYPPRLLFYNPSPVYGQLRTNSSANVTLKNVDATEGVNLLYTGGSYNYTTRPIEYRAGYHRFTDEPTIIREVGAFYRKYPDGARVQKNSFITGKQITLVTVNGSLQENSMSTTSVETVPLSAPARTVAVKNETQNIEITVPTQLDNSTWAEMLRPQYKSNGGHIVEQSYTESSPYNFLTITLERGVTYNLRMARVGVGTQLNEPGPAYLTAVSGDNESVVDNGVLKVTVEVRDRYNNPVAGKKVNLSIVGSDNGTFLSNGEPKATVTTGADGRATVTYQPPNVLDTRHVDIRASSEEDPSIDPDASFDLTNRNNMKIDVKVVDTGGPIGEPPIHPPNRFDVTDDSTGAEGESLQPKYSVDWTVEDSPDDNQKNSDLDTVELRLINDNDRVVDSVKYDVSGETASDMGTELKDELLTSGPYTIKIIYSDNGGFVREAACGPDQADGSFSQSCPEQ